jgi:hypothetical protein
MSGPASAQGSPFAFPSALLSRNGHPQLLSSPNLNLA